jgi:alanine racemase
MRSYLTAEISASAVRHNAGLIRRCIPAGTKLCAVVKADCYGHGLATLLGVLEDLADCLAVTSPEEAIQLRQLGYERPLLMFFSACAHPDRNELWDLLAELIIQQVTLTIVSGAEVAMVGHAARRVGAPAEVHVKIDTGMSRSGVLPEQAPALIQQARAEPGVRLTGAYTHFATADAADKAFTREQLARFLAAVDAAGGGQGLTLHAANSAAAIDLPEAHLDMVRPGIALYGYQPSDEMLNRLPLRPSMRLTGRLMQLKTVPAGSSCGYGLTHTFAVDTLLGLVPVGYADGYMRCLSNNATMRIRGREVPVRGRVAMDQVIIDLTHVLDAAIGDEVEIISNDPDDLHSVESLVRTCCTIPYELTCRIGSRARRVLVD